METPFKLPRDHAHQRTAGRAYHPIMATFAAAWPTPPARPGLRGASSRAASVPVPGRIAHTNRHVNIARSLGHVAVARSRSRVGVLVSRAIDQREAAPEAAPPETPPEAGRSLTMTNQPTLNR